MQPAAKSLVVKFVLDSKSREVMARALKSSAIVCAMRLLAALRAAASHYDVLGVSQRASAKEIKQVGTWRGVFIAVLRVFDLTKKRLSSSNMRSVEDDNVQNGVAGVHQEMQRAPPRHVLRKARARGGASEEAVPGGLRGVQGAW